MNECFSKKYILNGELQPAESFDSSLVYEGESIYEVLRIRNGTPLFFSDHIARLAASVRIKKRPMLCDEALLKNYFVKLARTDKKKEVNLKIVFNYKSGKETCLLYFIEPLYPTPGQYQSGVKGILFFAERMDPESKVINQRLRSEISRKLLNHNAYEALLVNNDNRITEGSRSNIFFIKDDILYTAPDNVILNGITRKHIIDICSTNDIKIRYECVEISELAKYDASFMTGTSPMVLPFSSIDDYSFKVTHPLITQLRELYSERAEKSIINFRMRL